MKFLALFLTLFIYTTPVFSQVSKSQYQTDLDKLYAVLQQTPSFKAQIKGEALARYKKLYDSLGKLDGDRLSSSDYFISLSQMFFPIRDNHLGFYEVFDNKHLADTASYRKFRMDLEKASYETVLLDLDSLKQVLSNKNLSDVEGIYHYGKYYSFGLYKNGANQYRGVILDSKIPHWKKGQVLVSLFKDGPDSFRAVYANPLTKKLYLYPNEKFRNQSLINSYFSPSFLNANYKKTTDTLDFVNVNKKTPAFELRNLRNDVQYLRLGNFSAHPSMMPISDSFYESMKDSLSAENLIVDLRNNTGGAEKVSGKFFKLIKKHASRAQIFVLVNNGTLSQGEIFLLQLKPIKNVRSYGQTTQGKIAYGSNYGTRVKLTSGQHEVYITDMKDKKGLVKYENVGVKPDVIFDSSTDWLERLLVLIDAQ